LSIILNRRLLGSFTILTALSVASLSTASPGYAAGPAPVSENAPGETVPAAPAFTLASPAVSTSTKNFKASPSESSWQSLIGTLKSYLADPRVAKAAPSQVLSANPVLKDVGTKVFDAGGVKVWCIGNDKQSQTLILQSSAPQEGMASVSTLPLTESVYLTGARIVRSFTTSTIVIKKKRKKITETVTKPNGPPFLILAGSDRSTGLIWLKAFRAGAGGWNESNEPFASIPPYLLQNVSGSASFSGCSLVLSVSSGGSNASNLPKPKSTTYQILLKLNGSQFGLAGKPSTDMPVSIVSYFVHCLTNNRLDLAKGWLKDPALLSIPKYVGVIGKPPSQPYKLVAMSTPAAGPRYRLVTYGKHDLIFDMGKDKQQWIIKGIFIAPPDPLAKALTGTMVGASVPGESESKSDESAAHQ